MCGRTAGWRGGELRLLTRQDAAGCVAAWQVADILDSALRWAAGWQANGQGFVVWGAVLLPLGWLWLLGRPLQCPLVAPTVVIEVPSAAMAGVAVRAAATAAAAAALPALSAAAVVVLGPAPVTVTTAVTATTADAVALAVSAIAAGYVSASVAAVAAHLPHLPTLL